MAVKYYNAIVMTDYDAKITYHNISNPQRFVDAILKTVSVTVIFFYRLPSRSAKKGIYSGYWNIKKGLILQDI